MINRKDLLAQYVRWQEEYDDIIDRHEHTEDCYWFRCPLPRVLEVLRREASDIQRCWLDAYLCRVRTDGIIVRENILGLQHVFELRGAFEKALEDYRGNLP